MESSRDQKQTLNDFVSMALDLKEKHGGLSSSLLQRKLRISQLMADRIMRWIKSKSSNTHD